MRRVESLKCTKSTASVVMLVLNPFHTAHELSRLYSLTLLNWFYLVLQTNEITVSHHLPPVRFKYFWLLNNRNLKLPLKCV